MKLLRDCIIPLLIMLSLYLYEASAMRNVAMISFMEYESGAESVHSIILLTAACLLYLFLIILCHQRRVFNKAEKPLLRFLIYTLVISYLWSIIIPFQSRITCLTTLLPLLFFFSWRRILPSSKTQYLHLGVLLFFMLMVYQYAINYSQVLFLGSDTTANNASYFILYLVPFLLCLENKAVKIFSIIISGVVVVSSFKRGGTIAFSLACIVYYLLRSAGQQNRGKKIWSFVLLSIFALCFATYLLSTDNAVISHLFERFTNIKQDNGSGRTEAFFVTIKMFSQSDIIPMVFGHGWNMVERESPLRISAHNDFLECMYDFGIIGIILLVNLLWKLFKFCHRLYKDKNKYAAPFAASLVIFVCNSMVSHIIIYPYYWVIFVLFWTYIFVSTTPNMKTR